MAVISSIGGTLSYNTSLPTAEDASSYGALSSWSEIENVIDVSAINETAGDTTHVTLKDGWTIHNVGAKDIPPVDVTCSYDESDATNINALKAYSNSTTVLAFKFTNAAGRTWYWKGGLFDFGPTPESADSHDGRSFQIRNKGTALVEVAPA